MPYLKRTNKREHRCPHPNSERGMRRAGVGSVWACPTCHQQWAIGQQTTGDLYWRKLRPSEYLHLELLS